MEALGLRSLTLRISCVGGMTVFFSMTGDLQKATAMACRPSCIVSDVVYTVIAYMAITFHMALVKEFVHHHCVSGQHAKP